MHKQKARQTFFFNSYWF